MVTTVIIIIRAVLPTQYDDQRPEDEFWVYVDLEVEDECKDEEDVEADGGQDQAVQGEDARLQPFAAEHASDSVGGGQSFSLDYSYMSFALDAGF